MWVDKVKDDGVKLSEVDCRGSFGTIQPTQHQLNNLKLDLIIYLNFKLVVGYV